MKLNPKIFILNDDQKRWARARTRNRKKYGKKSVSYWFDLIAKQRGLCALTGICLFFDARSGMSQKGGPGCHPLYAAADHIEPGNNSKFQIICYDLNDMKGHMPKPLFDALTKTKEWRLFIKKWKLVADKNSDREIFKELIRLGK